MEMGSQKWISDWRFAIFANKTDHHGGHRGTARESLSPVEAVEERGGYIDHGEIDEDENRG
jgi:hypothetical protein